MNLESPTVTVNKSAEDVFEFLTKVENYNNCHYLQQYIFVVKGGPP
jgi:hypothetical protein